MSLAASADIDPPAPSFGARMRAHFWLKGVGTSLGMTIFFIAYFALLKNPLFPVTVVPPTWFDALVGFHPLALVPYVSLWLYISLVPAVIYSRRELWAFGFGCLGLGATGLAIFLFWPTTFVPPDIDWAAHPSVAFLKSADAAGNACPSLHVAFSVFTGLWFARLFPRLGLGRGAQLLNLAWAALIVHSTLATKQHLALDAWFGMVLGGWAAALNFLACPNAESAPISRLPLFAAAGVIKLGAVLLATSGVPLAICATLFVGAGLFVGVHCLFPGTQGLLRVVTRFAPSSPDAREVWLTIDDGPDPDDTPRLLDLLEKHDARATFFLIGALAEKHPALVAEIARRGHEVAHHTHSHATGLFWASTSGKLAQELDRPLAAFAAAGVPRPRLFRPPVGIKHLRLRPALAARDLVCVAWGIRSHDSFARDPETVAARVLRQLRPGAIILMHEGPFLRPTVRVEAVRLVLEGAAARGYRCVVPTTERLV